MELIILGLILWYFWVTKPREKAEENGHPGSNPSLQMIYELDEFYRLRLRYDELIEGDWRKYRSGETSREQYKEASRLAIDKIVSEEDVKIRSSSCEFNTLFRMGVRNAAYRVAREGFNPGVQPYTRNKRQLKEWVPTGWLHDKDKYERRWRDPHTRPTDFLKLYPDPFVLATFYYVGTWRREDNRWLHDRVIHPGLGSDNYGLYAEASIEHTKLLLLEKGYNGKTYLNEPQRDYGDLTENEIKMKYEFLIDKEDFDE